VTRVRKRLAPPKLKFASTNYIDEGHHYTPHAHEFHELVFMQMGRMLSHVAGQEYNVCTGDFILYPAGTVHEEWVDGNTPALTWMCAFDWDELERDHVIFSRDARGVIQEKIARIVREYLNPHESKINGEFDPASLQALLTEVRRLTAPEPQVMVDQVRTFMRENMKESFTLDELAAIAGRSKYHFVRHYRKITGRTPMEDARVLRAEMARHLILTTSLPLDEIAAQVGVDSDLHLSRLLKAILGVSVRDLRHAAKA